MSSNNPESAVCGSAAASTVSAETVTGWHVVKVEGYSQLKALGPNNYIQSATFIVGGHRWYILLYPNSTYYRDPRVAVVLCLDEIPRPIEDAVTANLKFTLLDQAGDPVQKHTSSNYWYHFSSEDMTSGLYGRSLIKRKVLESYFLKNDSFQVRCDVTVLQKIRTKITSESPVMPPMDLQRQLGDLLASKVGGDVRFEVQGELFMAHPYMLAARSPVFMAELFGPTKEKKTGLVQVEDMEARVFKIMLHFIYTDTLPEIEDGDKIAIAQHLLVAADRYDIQKLELMCEDMLCSSVDISTVSTTLVLAEQHSCLGLKAACFEFLKSLLEELLVMVAP